MKFAEKLNQLMNITHVSNKELAEAIFVDYSLISMLRNGKRGIPRNKIHVKNMSLFFANQCTADFQKHALTEITGNPVFQSTLSVNSLAYHIEKWLIDEDHHDIVDEMMTSLDMLSSNPITSTSPQEEPIPSDKTYFYYDDQGRRESMHHILNIIRNINTACSIYVTSDADLEWLFDDHTFIQELKKCLNEAIAKGFQFYHIMPSSHHLNTYVKSLRYWLPMYITGQVKVFYYPRVRDHLYQNSLIVIPQHCVLAVNGITQNNHNHISIFSTDPKLIEAYTMQYQDYLSLCREAIITHNDVRDFYNCLGEVFSKQGMILNKVYPLSANTLPKECLEQCIRSTNHIGWKKTFQLFLDEIPRFEDKLKNNVYIDISHLSSVEDIREGKVPIASPFKTIDEHPCYSVETYILHLENILRLMDQYENYYFVPTTEIRDDYNLVVNEEGIALLIKNSPPTLMLEIHRPELVNACKEHLMRMAEQVGDSGIDRNKIKFQLQNLIKELRN